MIEAMACGTPVIAFKSGSVGEVIDEGVSGFLVETLDQGSRGCWPDTEFGPSTGQGRV